MKFLTKCGKNHRNWLDFHGFERNFIDFCRFCKFLEPAGSAVGDRRVSFTKNFLAGAVFFIKSGLTAARVAFRRGCAALIAVGWAKRFSVLLARFVTRLVRIPCLAT